MFTKGTANADVLNGGAGDDTLYGAGGADRLIGNGGNDVLTGDAGNDTLSGGAGEDYLMGGAGNDSLDGGADADWAGYEDATAAVKVDLNLTTAQNTLGGGTDTLKNIENLQGSAFNDTLIGNAASNYLHGGAGADSLFGGAGDDHFDGGAGNDTLNGGAGDDVVSYENGFVGGVTLDLNLTTGQANGAHGTDTLISIEAIWGSGYDDRLTGNIADNYLYGGAGVDLLKGGEGADVLDGATGNDTLVGGAGADDLTGGAGDDLFQFVGGDSGVFNSAGGVAAGTTDVINDFAGGTRGTGAVGGTGDTLDFGLLPGSATGYPNYIETTAATSAAAQTAASAAFAATPYLQYIATQVGQDVLLFYSDYNGGESHGLVNLKGTGLDSISAQNIIGSAVGLPGLNLLGTAGDDTLNGQLGQDTLQGLNGSDVLDGAEGNDLLIGGDGDDYLQQFGLLRGLGDDTLDGGAGNDVLLGGAGNDLLLGGAGDDLFQMASQDAVVGTQRLYGGAGDDTLYAGYGVIFAYGEDGNDFIKVIQATSAYIDGGVGNDGLFADHGDNTIVGGAGEDLIGFSWGANILTGGAGNDHFGGSSGLFENETLRAGTMSVITDFDGGTRGAGVAGGTGDTLDIGANSLAASATNYIENTAATYALAEQQASASYIANAALRFIATQVGTDVYVFYGDQYFYDNTHIDGVIKLNGVTLAGISAESWSV